MKLLLAKLLFTITLLASQSACVVGTAVGVVTDVAVETAKVPFKVGGAVVDVVTDDEEE